TTCACVSTAWPLTVRVEDGLAKAPSARKAIFGVSRAGGAAGTEAEADIGLADRGCLGNPETSTFISSVFSPAPSLSTVPSLRGGGAVGAGSASTSLRFSLAANSRPSVIFFALMLLLSCSAVATSAGEATLGGCSLSNPAPAKADFA